MEFKDKTRDGTPVKIYAVLEDQVFGIHGAIKTDSGWRAQDWVSDGHYFNNDEANEFDLIPIPELKKDDPIIVYQSSNSKKYKRHFSHFNDAGQPVCFFDGKTSWTTTDTFIWHHYKLPEEGTSDG